VELRKAMEQTTLAQRMLLGEIERANSLFRRASTAAERESARSQLTGLYDRMDRTLGELEMMQAHLQAICASQPSPDGWLGIDFSADLDLTATSRSTSFTFTKYPLIVSVQPNSPADKAGLAAGDEILALGEHDMVSGAIDIARLLRPGTRLPVRYRRDGAINSISVLVEPKPEGYASACPWIELSVAPPVLATQPRVRILRKTPNGFGFVFVDSAQVVARPRTQTRVEVIAPGQSPSVAPELPPTPYTPSRMAGVIAGNRLIAGAVLIPLTQDAREGLGIKDGILVIDVLAGSPAREAGLRAGDVILTVQGRKATSIPQLRLALDSVRDGVWQFKVKRQNAIRVVVMRRPEEAK
jgi:serine protease Do